MKNRNICEITITDSKTGEKVTYKLSDFNLSLQNDSDSVPTKSGDFLVAPTYSKGFSINLIGYIENTNILEEFNEALDEAEKR